MCIRDSTHTHSLGSLFQLLYVQLTDLVVVVDRINRLTEYLMEEGQGNNLYEEDTPKAAISHKQASQMDHNSTQFDARHLVTMH